MLENENQNEVAQQIKKLELAVDSDSGFDRSTGSSNQLEQSGNTRELDEGKK